LEEKFELHQFLKVIKERKIIIMLGTLVCLLFAKVATDYTPPVYQTSVKMLISQGRVTSEGQPLGESYQAILLSERLTMTFSEMLTSRTLAERVAKELELPLSPEDLQMVVMAEAITDTQLIQLTVTDNDPIFAKELADTFAAEFIEMTEEVIPASALINVRVVDRAAVPSVPVSPKPLLNLISAFLVGITLSTGFAFILGMLDVTIKEKEEIEQLVKLPSLGQTPSMKGSLLLGDYDSATAESYRSIRTNLQYINFDHSIKTLVVSSPSVNEGKTTVASNLAIVFAQAGYRVLLIDSDLRGAMLGALFDRLSSDGLSNTLIGLSETESVIQSTDIERLYLIASGPTPPNPADLLNSERMDKLLGFLKENFDLIIIDCPPILAVADTPIVASKADAVLLVSRFGKTKKSEMISAKDALVKVGARIAGFVINGARTNDKSKFDQHYRKSRAKQKAA